MAKTPRSVRLTPEQQALFDEMIQLFVHYELQGELPRDEIQRRVMGELKDRIAVLNAETAATRAQAEAMLSKVLTDYRNKRR